MDLSHSPAIVAMGNTRSMSLMVAMRSNISGSKTPKGRNTGGQETMALMGTVIVALQILILIGIIHLIRNI